MASLARRNTVNSLRAEASPASIAGQVAKNRCMIFAGTPMKYLRCCLVACFLLGIGTFSIVGCGGRGASTASSNPGGGGGGGNPLLPTVVSISPASGLPAGGYQVTITGTNFTGATAVQFGGSVATNVVVVSTTEITATAPPGTAASTVDVTVTTPVGTSVQNTAAVGAPLDGDQFLYAASTANYYKGMSYPDYVGGGTLSSSLSDQSLFDMNQIGVNTVSIDVFEFLSNETDTDIRQDFTTPGFNYSSNDASVRHAIEVAKSLGMKVVLKPMIDLENGDPRSGIMPSAGFFASYDVFIDRYAALAEQEGVDLFVVGSGLDGTQSDSADWQSVILGVRGTYSGLLTYACSYANYSTINWWNTLDFVGINAYFPLVTAQDPSPIQGTVKPPTGLDGAFATQLAPLTTWLKKSGLKSPTTGKPLQILFTEVGYPSVGGANDAPGSYDAASGMPVTPSGPYDPQVQEYCYQAVFDNSLVEAPTVAGQQATWVGPQSWFAGVLWWDWTVANPAAGGSGDMNYTPQNKPAQNVLQSNYAGFVGTTLLNEQTKLKTSVAKPTMIIKK